MYELPIDSMDEFTACPLEDEVSSFMIDEITLYLKGVALKDRIKAEVLPAIRLYGMIVLEGIANSGSTLGIHKPPLSD